MKKKLTALFLVFSMCFSLFACAVLEERGTADTSESTDTNVQDSEIIAETDETWAIYWYLCGSDLETEASCATVDLNEMLSVELPENVEIIIQTGGAKLWNNDVIDATKTQRWLYNKDGFTLIEEKPLANMGSDKTLTDFLTFASSGYPADKVAVLFWNHGGGTLGGAAYDENYGFDSLSLKEMKTSFGKVWGEAPDTPPVDLVGFDACLMATVDTAATFSPFAKYLVASQENEPGNGWNYEGWVGKLAKDPSMTASELGIIICNTYYDGCEEMGTESKVTLSVTDLTKLPALLEAYEEFGKEALVEALTAPEFFAQLGREASVTENYGSNSNEYGFTDMLDLGHFARKTAWRLPCAQDVLDALDDCIVHTVNGKYRTEASGLSCFYSYSGDPLHIISFIRQGTGTCFKVLYALGVLGLADGEASILLSAVGIDLKDYLGDVDAEDVSVPTLDDVNWDDHEVGIDSDNRVYIDLGPKAKDILTSLKYYLCFVDIDTEILLMLGNDNDIVADWENGVFTDNFRGVWGAINGNIVYMELAFEGEGYNLYSSPIMLNGEEYMLQVAYDFKGEKWEILGATQSLDNSGMASKELRMLTEGDVITTLWIMSLLDGDFDYYEVDEFTYTESTEFHETELGDGCYAIIFEMSDIRGNVASSEAALFYYEDGERTYLE